MKFIHARNHQDFEVWCRQNNVNPKDRNIIFMSETLPGDNMKLRGIIIGDRPDDEVIRVPGPPGKYIAEIESAIRVHDMRAVRERRARKAQRQAAEAGEPVDRWLP